MNNLVKKIVAILAAFVLVTPLFQVSPAYAAETASISVSSRSVSVGDDFSVSISINASSTIVAAQVWITYDPSIIELTTKNAGGSGTASVISYGDSTMTLSFKAKSPGSSALRISDDVVAIGDEIKTTTTKSNGSVTVSAPVSYSTDNTLSSLEISPGVLSPAFSPSVTEYTTSVGADVSQLVVNATPNDGSASVSVSGKKLDPGRNTTTITVTAEDGSKRRYVIYTTKEGAADSSDPNGGNTDNSSPDTDNPDGISDADEAPVIPTVKVGGVDYTISNDFAAHPLPSGYEVADFDYDGHTIQVGKGVNTKLILMYLESADGSSGFYVYDSVAKTFTPYNEVSQPQITYVILPITDSMEKPEGYKLTTYKINDKEASVLMDDTKSFALFYGVSSTGVTGWFRYDCKDGTIQSFTDMGKAVQAVENTTVSNDTMWKNFAIVAGVTCAALFIAVIVLAIKAAENKKRLLEAIKDGSGGSNNDLQDDLLADDYEDEEDDALLDEDEDEDDLSETAADDDVEMQKSFARAQKEQYQKEVAATVEATKEDTSVNEADDMFDAVSKALEKNMAETAFAQDDSDDDLDFLDIEEFDDKKN